MAYHISTSEPPKLPRIMICGPIGQWMYSIYCLFPFVGEENDQSMHFCKNKISGRHTHPTPVL